MDPFVPMTLDLILLISMVALAPASIYFGIRLAKSKFAALAQLISFAILVLDITFLMSMDQSKIDDPVNVGFILAIVVIVVCLIQLAVWILYNLAIRGSQLLKCYFYGDSVVELHIINNKHNEK